MIGAYIAFAVIILLTVAFAIGVQKYYADPYETQPLSSLATVISFVLLLLSVFIIPIDIYNISRPVSVEEKHEARDVLANLYYTIYVLLLVNSFVFIPFTYFFHEGENLDATIKSKFCGAIKYTLVFIIVLVTLMVAGLFLRDKIVNHSSVKDLTWLTSVFQDQNQALYAISFTVACFTAIGVCLWIVYTGYGMAVMPLTMIKGSKSPLTERDNIDADTESLLQQNRSIHTKYAMTGRTMSEKDRVELERLKSKERALKQRAMEIESSYDNIIAKILVFFAPFGRLLGLIALGCSGLLWISWLLGGIDKIRNSTCGISCGFILNASTVPNPTDIVLLLASRIFPMDYLILIGIVLLIFAASLFALFSLGVRIAWVQVYRIAQRATQPPALLMVAAYMTLIIFALTIQVPTLAPQYATFGTQSIVQNGASVQCSNDNNNHGACVRSQLSILVLQMETRSQFFGVFFFFANWIFLLSSLICGLVFIWRVYHGTNDSLLLSGYDEVANDDI